MSKNRHRFFLDSKGNYVLEKILGTELSNGSLKRSLHFSNGPSRPVWEADAVFIDSFVNFVRADYRKGTHYEIYVQYRPDGLLEVWPFKDVASSRLSCKHKSHRITPVRAINEELKSLVG